ncbi:MAG: MFS transporter [Pirellulales bacterium]
MTQPDSTALAGRRRKVFAWAMYDWANSAYSTLSITVLVSYMQGAVLPGGWGILIWGWGIGLTELVVAILSPILGAVADARATKRHWMAGTALTGAVASMLMFFATPERPWLLVVLFLIANLGMELSLCFYNGFLPEIATEENMGRVSAAGYALGYLGGGLALLIFILLYSVGDKLGLPTPKQDASQLLPRLGLLIMGVWWGVFTLPAIFVLRDEDRPSAEPQRFLAAARKAFGEVGHTLRNVRAYRVLALFLLGFLLYNDGVQTVISQASVFASKVLEMNSGELAQVILMIQFIALPGATVVGWMADRVGQKPTLMACLAVWVVLLVAAFFVTTKLQFWLLAAMVALVLGGTQSVSRSIMALMTPRARTAEFFGFFNLSGKATSVFGPILFSSILAGTGSAHWAIVSLLVFFVVGWAITAGLDIAQGQRQALRE